MDQSELPAPTRLPGSPSIGRSRLAVRAARLSLEGRASARMERGGPHRAQPKRTGMELVQGGGGEVRQSEVIAALSHALDMTEGHPSARPSAAA